MTAQFTSLQSLRHLCVKTEEPQWHFRGLNMRQDTWFLRCCFEVIKTIIGLSDVNKFKDTFISCRQSTVNSGAGGKASILISRRHSALKCSTY
jgi:hypothetical protein